jgi:hypothetical protein
MFGNDNPRIAGVRTPVNQSTEQAPANTVTKVAPAQWALIEYGDETGRAHTSLVLICGDKAWLAPNAEAWTSALKPFRADMSRDIVERLRDALPAAQGGSTEPLPSKDDVSVF